ncbi:ustiloxin B cluster transcription factor ustR [Colletotrichum sidae]|uniref:Ustiloxin B cluster transcription factor ustR n=1 Tax=Colletotrichum sidae TaxID=1347389 RepID=A0A4R8TKC0_9PEZI|nr:ustiloxin B cluster transcription factor ustR [Colletotrichum sidae]
MGPAPVQRRKSGCWTCRLRRKRCSEGGPPCINCVNRQVYCHGYGPKPEWKDKGEKERQEAIRLQLRSPTGPRRRVSSVTRSNPDVLTTPASTPGSSMVSLSSPPLDYPAALSTCSDDLDLDLSLEVDVDLDRILFGEQWPSFKPHEMNTLPVGPTSLPTPLTPDLGFSLAAREPHLGQQSTERELDLIMYYLDHVCFHDQGQASKQPRGWLLSALMASPGFYYAAIAASALTQHRDAQRVDGLRSAAYHDYQNHLTRASQIFSERSWGNVPGEDLICAVHLYRLEASNSSSLLSKQIQPTNKWQTLSGDIPKAREYFESALSALGISDSHGNGKPAMSASQVSSSISPASARPCPTLKPNKAMVYSQSLLVWTDILTCSARGALPCNRELYHHLFADDAFCSTFQATTGCASWVPQVISACSSLGAWKKDQERHSGLSIRALVSRSDEIASSIERRLEPKKEDSTGNTEFEGLTSIYGHAALVYLNVVVSGANPRVPEVSHAIDRAVRAWSPTQQQAKLRSLLWPALVVGSLAEGCQREFFQELVGEPAGRAESMATPVGHVYIYSVLQSFWQALEGNHGESAPVASDWKAVLDKHGIDLLLA